LQYVADFAELEPATLSKTVPEEQPRKVENETAHWIPVFVSHMYAAPYDDWHDETFKPIIVTLPPTSW
jgi:hypothetical protein